MHPIQAAINAMSAQWQRERSATQMTLGKLIERLKALPQGLEMEAITSAHSYRGYYCDLAFERGEGKMMVKDALHLAQFSIGEAFMGYKGGTYWMENGTPVWLAEYGRCGLKIMALRDDGTFETAEDTD